MINSFSIISFRGIRGLNINKLKRVNLILGDNNCGKTSILEALFLLRNVSDFSNVIKASRLRKNPSETAYEDFIYMFPSNSSLMNIAVSATTDTGKMSFDLSGKQHRVLLDESDLRNSPYYKKKNKDMETDEFKGKLRYECSGRKGASDIRYNPFISVSGAVLNRNRQLNMVYLSPDSHFSGSIINNIVGNNAYKEICLNALRLFDPDIVDMMILKSSLGSIPVEYLKHKALGNMPLSTFGDGIKKVLVLSNAIVQSAGGILLIDEVETSIHKKYYDDIFRFLIKVCEAYNVQLFVTTHSMEAIDAILGTQDYDKQTEADIINVVTVKNHEGLSVCRVLDGREVYQDRRSFGFEVRL